MPINNMDGGIKIHQAGGGSEVKGEIIYEGYGRPVMCEGCGTKNQLNYIIVDEVGYHHYFCSQECEDKWVELRNEDFRWLKKRREEQA